MEKKLQRLRKQTSFQLRYESADFDCFQQQKNSLQDSMYKLNESNGKFRFSKEKMCVAPKLFGAIFFQSISKQFNLPHHEFELQPILYDSKLL